MSRKWKRRVQSAPAATLGIEGDALYQAFISEGLTVAPPLLGQPRSIFDNKPGDTTTFYDQIAWFTDKKRKLLNLTLKDGGNFDFLPHVFTDGGLTTAQLSYRLSDHFPLWVEFDMG